MTSTVSCDHSTAAGWTASGCWRAARRLLRRDARPERPCPTAEPTDPPWLTPLVAGIVHEMGSPVGALASAADTMEALCRKVEAEIDDPRQAARLATLRELAALQRQTADRVKDTVRSLERFVDLDRSECRAVDLAQTIDVVLAVLGARDDARVTVEGAARAPEPVTSARLLNRVLLHVLERALDAAGPDGDVRVAVYAQGRDHVAISVGDTGPAIPDSELDGLAAPRLATRNARVALDLEWASSERALRAIGGRMTVQSGASESADASRPRGQTTVTLVLPLRVQKEIDG